MLCYIGVLVYVTRERVCVFSAHERIDPQYLLQRKHLVQTLSDATARSEGMSHAVFNVQQGVRETEAVFCKPSATS